MARKTQLLYPGDLIALDQRTGVRGDQKTDFMHKDTPFGELALISPNGQHHPRLDWQHELPVPLLKNVQRLTCGNPGVMTGPGTNSYIVGDVTTGHIVIDPGPNEAEHLQRLWQACGGDHTCQGHGFETLDPSFLDGGDLATSRYPCAV